MSKASKQTKVEVSSKASSSEQTTPVVVESAVDSKPKKNTAKKTETTPVTSSSSEAPVDSKKSKKSDVPVADVPVADATASKKVPRAKKAPVVESVEVSDQVAPEDSDVKKQRRQVNREEVDKTFDSLIQSVEDEIENNRKAENKKKSGGVKFLRTVSKHLKQLKVDFLRVTSKGVKKAKAERPNNSGFMKAVRVSGEMQKFAGVKDDQLISRVDVTKSICKYVKDNNLQNQDDRRQFTPDEKLAKLLGTNTPLTYYNLQKNIQRHFLKDVPASK
jgi:chromatin remodeling complex protein RSC6